MRFLRLMGESFGGMKRFWNWSGPQNQRVLTISGTIAEDSWVDDEVTPQVFQDELSQGKGPIDLWLNSPGAAILCRAMTL